MYNRETYPEAIVCANDYMAISVCEALRKRGVRVPEDVCVSGFDYVTEAVNYEPTLTSMQVDFVGMSKRAVDIIDNVNKGIKEDSIQYFEANLLLNKSCGCGKQQKTCEISQMIDDNYRQIATMKNIMLSTIEYQDAFELDECFAVADKYKSCICSQKAFLCLSDFEDPSYREVENDSRFTDKAVLKCIFDRKNPMEKPNIWLQNIQMTL